MKSHCWLVVRPTVVFNSLQMQMVGDHWPAMSGRRQSVATPPDDGAVYSNSSDGTYHTPSLASIYQVSPVIL